MLVSSVMPSGFLKTHCVSDAEFAKNGSLHSSFWNITKKMKIIGLTMTLMTLVSIKCLSISNVRLIKDVIVVPAAISNLNVKS